MAAQGKSVHPVNKVYFHLREKVKAVADQLREEYDTPGDISDNLKRHNRGVRFYKTRQDLLTDKVHEQELEVSDLIAEFKNGDKPIKFCGSPHSAVEEAIDLGGQDCMVVLYSPSASPLGVIYGGIPSTLTDLAIRSTLIWSLRSPSMYLQDGNTVELHAGTSFYLPSVEVRRDSFLYNFDEYVDGQVYDLSVMMMASVGCLIKYYGEQKADLSNIINYRLSLPFLMALRQNQNRKKLNLSRIRHIVIDDLDLNGSEFGVNTLVARQLQHLLKQFAGCFDSVTLCGPPKYVMHVKTHVECG